MNTTYFLPGLLISVGLALLVYMIVVEDEPGAVPLLLLLSGVVWALIARRRARSASRH
jgi:hypothetical protein